MNIFINKLIAFLVFFICLNANAQNKCLDYLLDSNIKSQLSQLTAIELSDFNKSNSATYESRLPFLEPIELRANTEALMSDVKFIKYSTDFGIFESFFEKLSVEFKKLFKDKTIKTLFYPAAGSDGSIGFKLFDSVDVVIGLDDHSFHLTDKKSVFPNITALEYQQQGWEYVYRVGEHQTVLNSFLSKLLVRFPNARILRIEVAKNRLQEGINGIVEFDLGPGTKVKKYIHILRDINSHEMVMIPQIFSQKIDVVIAKASMNIFESTNLNFGFLGEIILSELIKAKGLFIDGDAALFKSRILLEQPNLYNDFEISGAIDDPKYLVPNLMYLQSGEYSFGYSKKINIIDFDI